MGITAKAISDKLQLELDKGYNVARVANVAFQLYHDNGIELPEKVDDILLQLIAMEEGEEFELSECEVKNMLFEITKI